MSPHTEFLNLLLRDRMGAFRGAYFMRLLTVSLVMVTLIVVAHGVLLIPSYVYERIVLAKEKEHFANLAAQPTNTEESKLNTRLSALEANTTYLHRLAASKSITDAVRTILAVSRPGVTLGRISFSVPAQDPRSQLVLSGRSTTRELLRQYVVALSHVSGVASADVPIGAYTAETEINFSLTLTGPFLP